MLIKSLEKMELIVSRHNNLRWIGWDVSEIKRSDAGRTAVNGVRIKDKWYVQKVFKLTNQGWHIPNKYGE